MFQKKQFPIIPFLVLFIVIMILFYLGSGIFNVPDVSIYNLEESFIYAFLHPLEAYNDNTVPCMCVGLLLWFALVNNYLTYHRNYRHDAFGSDEWRDVKEANRFYKDKDDKNNRIVTQNLKISLEKGVLANNNSIIMAISGGYKTTSTVEQNLLQFASSYIVLDVKGELQRKWGKAFLKEGYTLHSLNFKTPTKSDQYNPFAFIEKEEDVVRIAASVLDVCRPKKEMSMQDPFWDDALLLYTQSLFYAEWLRSKAKGTIGSMNGVMELARWETLKKGQDERTGGVKTELSEYMDKLAKEYGDDYPPVDSYRQLKDGAPETVASVVLMFNSMLNICRMADVKRIFEGNDFDFREIGVGKKKSVIFLCIPDDTKIYNWIISLFYTQCLSILSRCADDEVCGPLPNRVEFWMDEFYAGCRPADVDQQLGIIRGRNICFNIVLQSMAQLEVLYPQPKYKVVMDNISMLIYLGSSPIATDTHEFISKLTGYMTVDIMNDSLNFSQQSSSGISNSQKDNALLSPTEVKRLSDKIALVFIAGSHPIMDLKAIPFDTRDGEYQAPKWLKTRYEKYRSYGNYVHPVEVIYDEEHFRYITIKQEEPFRVITDEKEKETLREAAKTDKRIFECSFNEEDFLYMSFGVKNYCEEEIKEIYQKAMEDERLHQESLKGLFVMQNVELMKDTVGITGKPEMLCTDKSLWDDKADLKTLLALHYNEMTAKEQEIINCAFAENFTEEQIKTIMLATLSDMMMWINLFREQNMKRG